jgi:N-acyl homoserine lactone hydrolase
VKIHAISTGKVSITRAWRVGRGTGAMRMAHTLFDREFTEWLPIYCYVIEHPEGLIVVDTGIAADAGAAILFPPWMRLVQRAARFQIAAEEEIGPQMRARGLNPEDVRWVVLTHLHQDHDGGLHHFPRAEVVVAQAEWEAARGLGGRLRGYQNQRWPRGLKPTCIQVDSAAEAAVPAGFALTRRGDVRLIPSPGHSAGHMAVLVDEGERLVCLAGDIAYTQELLIAQVADGIGVDPLAAGQAQRMVLRLARTRPLVFLPCHEWDAARRLAEREPLVIDAHSALANAAGVSP